jgi:dynein heavy chain, axonemal
LTAGFKFDRDGLFTSFEPCAKDPYKSYTEYIDSLPLNPSPQVFGIHENASIACANTEAFQIFDICQSLQRNSATGAKENVLEQTVESTASTLYAKVQTRGTYDIEAVQLSYPVVYEESMNTVLIQECIRYNKLVSVILGSLPQLLKALKGSVAMTAELEATANRYSDCEDIMSIGLYRCPALIPCFFFFPFASSTPFPCLHLFFC